MQKKLQNYKHSCKILKPVSVSALLCLNWLCKIKYPCSTKLQNYKITNICAEVQKTVVVWILLWEVAIHNYKITQVQKFLQNFKNFFSLNIIMFELIMQKNISPVEGRSTKLQNYKHSCKTSKQVSVSILLCLKWLCRIKCSCRRLLFK